MDVQDSKKAHLLVDFPWQEVSFHLDDEGNFQVTKELHEVWKKYGFFVVKNLFSKTTMTSLEACTKDSNIQNRLQPRIDEDGYKLNFVLWNNCDNGLFGAIARCEKVVHPIQQVLGDEIYHYHTKLVLKDGHSGGAFNWHQDYGYWYKNGCLAPDLATMWTPLDNVDSENGCLKVIPGSHKLGRIEHKPVNNQVTADPERVKHVIKRFGFVYVEMNVGDGLFFHSNILHSSEANFSNKRRWAIINSYNTKSNNPVYKHHHPNYYPLESIKNKHVAAFHGKFGTDYKFLVDGEDKSLREGYNEADEVVDQ